MKGQLKTGLARLTKHIRGCEAARDSNHSKLLPPRADGKKGRVGAGTSC